MSWEQLPLVGLEATQEAPEAAVTPVEASAGDLVPRTPGWTLLADADVSTNEWHRVASRRYDGLLTAVCGATGRYIQEDAHEIIRCSACDSYVPPE